MVARTLLFLCASLGLALQGQEAPPEAEAWSIHGQLTTITMGHGAFDSPYAGSNSFQARREVDTSVTGTLFAGARLWKGAEAYLDPEIAGGKGNSAVTGIAAFPNGEIYRVSSPDLKLAVARVFLRQTFDLGGTDPSVESDQNQLAGPRSSRRLTFTAGKFALMDIFDANAYAHEPRTQFMNWALMGNGAWDYPADTKGYTWGLAAELAWDAWAFRAATVLEPRAANQMVFDKQVSRAHGDVVEVEHAHVLGDQPGKVRLLGYANHARMGSYAQALEEDPQAPSVTSTRAPGRTKYGLGLNAEQQVTSAVGVFLRAGWNDGHTETWAFTEIDRTLTLGCQVLGGLWGRPQDRFGLAAISDGLSRDHEAYLAAGGNGFILGDGRLAYGPERVLEAYYALALASWATWSFDAQRVANPAYNQDRGPVNLLATRVHFQF